MNTQDYLLICLTEECAEIAQRATKALRFGLDEIQPGQTLNNKERLIQEIADLFGVIEKLELEIPKDKVLAKQIKIEKFMKYSKQIGRLQDDTN